MKRVYSAQSLLLVGYLEGLLANSGIDCLVRNRHLIGGAGELPPTAVWPELWVVDDADAPAARRLIRDALAPADGAPWRCPRCGEALEAQFALCWRCGAERPQASGP